MKCLSRKTISGPSPYAMRSIAAGGPGRAKDPNCMILFPNCKVNLGLRILRKRTDGYHDLDTLFYPLPVKDVLEIIRSDEPGFFATGIPIPGDPETNLCLRAFTLLKSDFPQLPPVRTYLHKHIPIG